MAISEVNVMEENKVLEGVKSVLENMPADWLNLTTHRLDIYEEHLAKKQFLDELEKLFAQANVTNSSLSNLPTAFDYIRLGHPLSCVLEWTIANLHGLPADHVKSFSSKTTPIMAVLRKNLFDKRNTLIAYVGDKPAFFNEEVIRDVYGYHFEMKQLNTVDEAVDFDGSTILIVENEGIDCLELASSFEFVLNTYDKLGSIIVFQGASDADYISEIQHVRRRETIAMTPSNTLIALKQLTGMEIAITDSNLESNKAKVTQCIKDITLTTSPLVVGSSGLSIQYAIVMGLVHEALEVHSGKAIKIIVPPNCYGGTNDQARRVAACIDNVEVVDLPVDGDHEMVASIDAVLEAIAKENAVPYIIAEIPTNPRVEVPVLEDLKNVLSKERITSEGERAIDPVFILDQTFCPNVHFLAQENRLSCVRTLAYVSGSKFPSGGKCTAGYCVSNKMAEGLMDKIALHLQVADNEATDLQYEILAEQLPSMKDRIQKAYVNTRDFVNYIQTTLPEAKINFVSEELALQEFTPSVFSLDLPTKGVTEEEREAHKRALNLKLINSMITEIPNESKFCVSYGQLKGCYWTIPATSTQGTTKEGDKDYIVRVALSGNMDLDKHKAVFKDFVESL